MTDRFAMWVIYRNPSDFPNLYVVRRSLIGRGTVTPDRDPTAVVDTLEQARARIPVGLHWQDRQPGDDPVIVEIWF